MPFGHGDKPQYIFETDLCVNAIMCIFLCRVAYVNDEV